MQTRSDQALQEDATSQDIELTGASETQGVALSDNIGGPADTHDDALRDPFISSPQDASLSIAQDVSQQNCGKHNESVNDIMGYDEDVNKFEDLDDEYGSVNGTNESETNANEIAMPQSRASRYTEGSPPQQSKKHKMNNFKTFFAVIKAYCAINVLLLPMQFVNGGYLLSPIMLLIACFFESLCAIKLSRIAIKYNIFSYPQIANKALGPHGMNLIRIMIALAHFQFTIGQLTFTLQSLQSTFNAWLGPNVFVPMWAIGIVIFLVYSPLIWVRRLSFLAQAFIFACTMIAVGVITTSIFAVEQIEAQGGSGGGLVPINKSMYWTMIGGAFFMFEGIGCLMPVARETQNPQDFPWIVTAALSTLCIIYIAFSELCYYTYGSGLDQPVVTEMLPADNFIVQIMKLLFCLNLVFSYPMTVFPVSQTLQGYVFGRTSIDQSTDRLTFWKVNLLRSTIPLAGICITLLVADKLDRVMGLAGSIFGMINVLIVPALCHYKLMAKTRAAKIVDIAVIIFAVIMLVICPATVIMQW